MVSVKKPFGCSVCHLSFRLAKSLVKHVAIHNSNESKSKIHNSSGAKSKILNFTGAKSKIHNSNEVQEKKFMEAGKETLNKPSENIKESKIKVQNSSLKSHAKEEANNSVFKSVPGSNCSIQVLKSKKYILWATLVNVAKEWPLG